MAAVTQRISNYLSGVSKQPDSKKLPGQVRECINGLADPTLGMTKRPGFKFVSKLKTTGGADFTGHQLSNAKWFYINRDLNKYIGCITSAPQDGYSDIYIWNADTGVACTVTISIAAWTANTAYAIGDIVKNDSGKIYKCDTAGTSAGSGGPTGEGSDITDNTARWDYLTTNKSPYLSGSKNQYDVLSVQANTIICNSGKTVETKAAPTDFIAASRGTVLLSGTAEQMFSQTWKITFKDTANSVNETATYSSGASDKFDDILDGLETALNAKNITGLTVTKYGTSLQLDYVLNVGGTDTRTPFALSAEGGFDNERLTVFQDWVSNPSHLPPNSFHNHVVTVVNSVATDADNYYTKFVADNETAGSGYWKETLGPESSTGLMASSMPHRLRNTNTNVFVFEPIPWEARLAGDDNTVPHPSFVGSEIKRSFYHDDRLGFLSEDNVILSKAKAPFDLYAASARTLTAGDPIDVNVASVRPTKLHGILPARQGLTLFSKNAQFLIYSDDGPLTPTSTKIRPISNMEMSDEVDPIDVGTHMNFISKTPNFVRVFAMTTRGLGENPDILDIGRVVNEWITINVDTFIASIQNEFIAMSSQSSDEIFFYKTYTDGKELLMESWFKWKLPGNVQSMAIDQDDMYCVTKQTYTLTDNSGNVTTHYQYVLSDANLTQSPEAAIITNSDGQKINPCIDFYTPASNGLTGSNLKTVVYDSVGLRSKCYIPFANLTDRKNIVLVAGTTAAGTYNNSGYTVVAEVASDSDGTFFIVDGLDLSSNAANVYVGYAYDFDLTLPQIYYQLDPEGKSTDFTGSLTIARLKFDTGLSGLLSFKLNAVGRFAGKREYTGDGTTTDFPWVAGDLNPIDRNQVKVKINNVTNTAFTFLSDTEIRFNSAPADGAAILIYLDEWYELAPSQMANEYLADDVPLDESRVVTIPIHQRSKNFSLRVFNDSPFPVSLNSMMWEGNYSPRFYRRT
ncbi:MAG: hypothetical protein CBD88_01850 [Flavobacteriales bacterium TMED228]|nr:MAG: hypothetical protein CBD88_01850 [Flavobacteriales bacterium TMED228]